MKFFKQQDGITLIIGMLMLGSVTLVSFSLSAVIIREIRSARLFLATEPAIAGANAGGEIGLYRFLRSAGGTTSSGSLDQSGATYDVVPDLYDDSVSFTVTSDSPLSIGLFDAENINASDVSYRSVTINNDPGSPPISVTLTSWAGTLLPCNPTIPPGQNATCILNGPDFRYLVKITRQAGGTSTGNLQAFDGNNALLGVPSPSPKLQVTGKSSTAQRRVEIRLNTQ